MSGSAPPSVRATLGRAPWTTAGQLSEARRVLVDTIRGGWADAGLGVSPVDSVRRLVLARDLCEAAGDVGQPGFDSAVHHLGWSRFQGSVWLVGLHRALAMTMRVARIPSPPETDEG